MSMDCCNKCHNLKDTDYNSGEYGNDDKYYCENCIADMREWEVVLLGITR